LTPPPPPSMLAPPRRGTVTLLVPARNEEAGIGRTLRTLPLATLEAQGFAPHVLVLDGRSSDRTRDIARARGAEVFVQSAPGKGNAVREGRHLVQSDYVVMLDADATYAPDAIPGVLEMLARGEADVVMGSRFRGQRANGAMTRTNAVGNVALSALASALFLRPCSDVCTGLWGFRGPVFQSLPLQSTGFDLEVELFTRAVKEGWRVREVGVDYMPRAGGPDGTHLHPLRDGMAIGLRIVRTRLAPRPVRREPGVGEHAWVDAGRRPWGGAP